MLKEIVNTVQTFLKREVSEKIGEVDKNPEGEVSQKVHKWFRESGLYRAILSEKKGGAGLSDRDIAVLLIEIAKVYPSFAMWLVSSFLSLLFLEKTQERIEDADVFGTNISFGKFVFASPFAEKLVIVKGDMWEVETPEGKSKLSTLGLKGCAVYDIDLSSPKRVNGEFIQELERKGLLWIGAVSVGNAISSFESAVEYASQRYQGGDVIIKHGIIREMLGRMKAKVIAGEAMLLRTIESGALETAELVKAFVTENCEQVCCDGVQVFGGYGYMKDYGMERRFRDSKTLCAIGGGNINLFKKGL